jgi:hypothetical protein
MNNDVKGPCYVFSDELSDDLYHKNKMSDKTAHLFIKVKKVKLPLYLIKHQARKTYGGVEV